MPAMLKPFLVTFAACLAIHVWPSGIFIWAVIWGIAIILGSYYMGLGQLLALIGSNMLLLLLLGDSYLTLDLLVFYALPVMVAAVLLKKGKSYYAVLGGALMAAVLSVVLYMGISYAYLGHEAIDNIKSGISMAEENSMTWAEQSGFMEFYEQRGISREEIKEAYQELAHMILVFTPALLCMQALMAMFLVIYFSSLLFTKKQLPGLERRPFNEEIMPWQLAWVVIAGLACWLLGRDQLNWLYYSGANILVIVTPLTIFYGCAVLVYWLQRLPAKSKKWITILVVLLGLFFSVPTIIFIGLIGLFDSLLDYRKIRRKKEGIE